MKSHARVVVLVGGAMGVGLLYPELGDRENINNWIDQGSSNIEERAYLRAREIIESHFPDHIDPEIEMRIRNEFPLRVQTGPSQTIKPRVA